MSTINQLYGGSLSLLTDLYQLTMAYGYWKCGQQKKEAVFNLLFRKNPFEGGYALACGLTHAVDFLKKFRFEPSDLEYLATLQGSDGKRLFEQGFLDHLASMELSCDVDAIPEGTPAFPQEPLLRVKGPLIQAQILETPLLNIMNFQTLIATKAARICQAAQGQPVLEFGLRRAQGIDGGLAASWAAYVGGCAATSNVLAGKLFGIPVKGTHAHSWVMSFDSEGEAFERYAEAMPNNCVFLVDTYDTLQGVRNACECAKRLRAKGYEMAGVRLDSGDLAYLSIEARKILDQAGFKQAAIVASNDLDENLIVSLRQQNACIGVWGIGTKLVTGYDQPALGGVYKLAAVRDPGGEWQYKIKLSEQAIKISTPGLLQVRRFRNGALAVGDMIYDEPLGVAAPATIVDPLDLTRRKVMPSDAESEDLLRPVFRQGKLVAEMPPVRAIRERAAQQLATLHEGIRRFDNPHEYPVGLEKRLFDLRTELILKARGIEK